MCCRLLLLQINLSIDFGCFLCFGSQDLPCCEIEHLRLNEGYFVKLRHLVRFLGHQDRVPMELSSSSSTNTST